MQSRAGLIRPFNRDIIDLTPTACRSARMGRSCTGEAVFSGRRKPQIL
jgi:hypothetical protein